MSNLYQISKELDILAKEFLGINLTVDMQSMEEQYYNPKYKEYIAFCAGYKANKDPFSEFNDEDNGCDASEVDIY